MKNAAQKGHILIVLAIITALIAGVLIYSKSNSVTQTPDPTAISRIPQTKVYKSKDLKIEISIPEKFQIEEKFKLIKLAYNDKNIKIDSIGTNYKDIEGYLNDITEKHNLTFLTKKNIEINGLKGILYKIRDPNNKEKIEKTYALYSNYTVFFLSTSDESLYPDLDQIAQSFRYTP